MKAYLHVADVLVMHLQDIGMVEIDWFQESYRGLVRGFRDEAHLLLPLTVHLDHTEVGVNRFELVTPAL